MTLEEAQQKFHQWGVLLLLDAPAGIEFGIDNTSWKVGNKFKGVKLIPPGAHLVHYSLKSEEHKFKLGFFIHIGKKKRVWVKKWNVEKEDFISLPTQEEEERYVMGVNSYQFDEFLGPYPLDRLQIWEECSNFITESVLDTLNPIERKVHQIEEEYRTQNYTSTQQQNKIDSLVMEFISSQNKEQQSQNDNNQSNFQNKESQNAQQAQNNQEANLKDQKMEDEEEIDLQKQQGQNLQQDNKIIEEGQEVKDNNQSECNKNNRNMNDIKNEIIAEGAKEDFRVMAGTIYYTDIPKIKTKFGKQGDELTQINIDKTPILCEYIKNRQKVGKENLLRRKPNSSQIDIKQVEDQEKYFIFGEFQYSFAMLLLLEDFESFEHWKNIFSILISSDKYIDENPDFFIEFIPVLYNILKQFPKDFFFDSISKDNFLKTLLSDFIEVTIQSANKKLSQRSKKLQKLLEEYFLFFPKKQIVEVCQGKYKFELEDDQDAPQIVDDQDPVYF
ncbi:hypothetical protein ABPG74_000135 [Tetrahymena malaccensis]